MSAPVPASRRRFPRCARALAGLAACVVVATFALLSRPVSAAPAATTVTSAQKSAALEYLAAVAGGNAQEVAYAIHPEDLEALRQRLLGLMREEAKRGESTVRSRLFGQAKPLNELERLTSIDFYVTLARRLVLAGRRYDDAEGIATVSDRAGETLVLLRGKQAREVRVRGVKQEERPKTTVVNVVALKPYGKDWKAAMPSEIEAQIEDLLAGRRIVPASALAVTPGAAGGAVTPGVAGTAGPDLTGSPAKPATSATPQGVTDTLNAAEKALTAGKCDEYYRQYMSPAFRKVTSKQALEALISSCQRGIGTREMLLSTIRIVKAMSPKLTYGGSRAEYDVSDQGLPFDTFVLERVDERWLIAE